MMLLGVIDARVITLRRFFAFFVSFAVAVAGLAAFPAAPALAAGSALTLVKEAPESVLVNGTVEYTLTASNTGSEPQYNVSFRDVLPAGLTYVATTPADLAPTVLANQPAPGQTTLIWRDAFDLQNGDSNGISFSVRVDPDQHPVGSTFSNTAEVDSSTDPRLLPTFNAGTTAISQAAITKVTALEVAKSEPSPESELLRGIHTQSTVYTLKVTNNSYQDTDAVTVTDYLPANLEYLGCGGDDHSSDLEFPEAPSLSDTPAVENCDTPAAKQTQVETVKDPAGLPAGIYTKVTWVLGAMTPGQVTEIKYRAGVPLLENTLFPADAGIDGVQAANLDNNTGKSTRQDGAAASAVNHVQAAGRYTGTVQDGTDPQVTAETRHTVTVHDLRIVKSGSIDSFSAGQVVTYTLTLAAGEYTSSEGIKITDVLPDGLCPLGDYVGMPADCADYQNSNPAGHTPSGADYQSVTHSPAEGTFTIEFAPLFGAPDTLAPDGTATVTYQALMRQDYSGGALATTPTSAGDGFENTVTQQGTTSPTAVNPVDSGLLDVTDPSRAGLSTDREKLTKKVGINQTPMTCEGATFVSDAQVNDELPDINAADVTFAKGDRVCFEITVDFSTTVDTRNAVVSDFLPSNLTFESAATVATGAKPVTGPDAVVFSEENGLLRWTLGTARKDQTRTVPADSTFRVVISAIVNAAPAQTGDKTGNLAKFRATNSAGQARSLREQANFLTEQTPVGINKSVAAVNGDAPQADETAVVRAGDTVGYTVAVTNESSRAIRNLQVWDVLPAELSCADVALTGSAPAISNGGACTDEPDGRSIIRWHESAVSLAPQEVRAYTYELAMPAGLGVAESLDNTAHVRSYEALTNIVDAGQPTTVTHYPGKNVDASVAENLQDPLPVADQATVVVPAAQLEKLVTSAVATDNNTGGAAPGPSTQATPGEAVSYTLTVRIPSGTTVFNGKLTDPLPAGLVFSSASAAFAPDAANPVYTDLDPVSKPVSDGGTVSFDAATGTLSLGNSARPAYANATGSDQLFRVTINAVLKDTAANEAAVVLTNTATFSSGAAAYGSGNTAATGDKPADLTAKAATSVVEPVPALTKTNNFPAPGTTVTAGQLITFTVTASNKTGASTLHSPQVEDCLPAGLTFVATIPSLTGGVSTGGPCAPGAIGTTKISWTFDDLAPGGSQTLRYTAVVDNAAAGSLLYTNKASLTGHSLTTDAGNPEIRSYAARAESSVKVAGAVTTKTAVGPTPVPVGGTATFELSTVLPAQVNFHNLSVLDSLPPGIKAGSVSLVADSLSCLPAADCAGLASPALIRDQGTEDKVLFLLGNAAAAPVERTLTLRYTAVIDADRAANTAGTVLTNTARPVWDTTPGAAAPTSPSHPFPVTGPNTTATVTVSEPGVSIAKHSGESLPEPGETFQYSILVSALAGANSGTAHNLVITDQVPEGIDVISVPAGASLSKDGRTMVWNSGSLAPGATLTLSYEARLAPSSTLTGDALTNTASVTSFTSLPGPALPGRTYEGPDSSATVTPALPELTSAKTAPAGETAVAGNPFTWQVTVSNNGDGAAASLTVTDVLPSGWTYNAGSTTASINNAAARPAEPAVAGRTLSWASLGTLPPKSSVVLTYQATPTTAALTTPGAGSDIRHTNSVAAAAKDSSGADGKKPDGNSDGKYAADASAYATIQAADLSLTKQMGAAPFAGATGSWQLRVTNNGPDPAGGPIAVTDAFAPPPGVAVSALSGDGWTCDLAAVSCVRADQLASGASFPEITVSYTVAADVAPGTTLTNTAVVSGSVHDPKPDNNSATAVATVSAYADLALGKALTGTLVAGQDAAYTLTVRNHGPAVSVKGFTVTDTIPAGTSFASATGTGWTCQEPTDNAVTCAYGKDLAAGATAPVLTLTLSVAPDTTTAVTNTATLTPVTPEKDPADTGRDVTTNNTGSATGTPAQQADVAVTKVLGTELVAGGLADYQITVANHGPSYADNIRITDVLDPLLTYESYTGTDWDCSAQGQTVTCDYLNGSSMPPTGPAAVSALTLQVRVAQQLQAPVANTATISSTTVDPDPSTNSSTTTGALTTARTDLALEKSHVGSAVAGSSFDYQLAVTNLGPSSSAGPVNVTDTLPEGMSFEGSAGPGWACSAADRLVTCTGADGLAAGATDTLSLTVAVDPGAGPQTLTNRATVTAHVDSPDLYPGNNTSTDPTDVHRQSMVSLTKTLLSAAPVVAGTNAVFELTATNAGPSDVDSLTVTDTLPQYLDFVSASGAGWTCSAQDRTVICERPTAGLGAQPTITITALVDASVPVDPATGVLTVQNTATVTTGTPGTVNNPLPVDVPISAQADLALTKSASAETVEAGGSLDWTLQVSNNGPSKAAGPLTVTDTLPAHQSYTAAGGTGWQCTAGTVSAAPGGQEVSCTHPDGLLPGTQAPPLVLMVQVGADAVEGTMTNTATVASATPDAAPADNTGTGAVFVDRVLALELRKSHTGNGVVGELKNFRLEVTNTGSGNADLVSVTDVLPAGLVFSSAAGTGWACAEQDGTVACDYDGSLAPGERAPDLQVTVLVEAAAYPSALNTATASSRDPQLPGGTGAEDLLTVAPSAQLSLAKVHQGRFQAGQAGTYTLTVTNTGPTATPGPIAVTDALPGSLRFVQADGDGWTCAGTGQDVNCERAGMLAAGASAELILTVDILSGAYPEVENTAFAAAPGSAPVSSTDVAPVLPHVAWSIEKTLEGYANHQADYIISVTNTGSNTTVSPALVTDDLPAGLDFVSAGGTGWICTEAGGLVNCSYDGEIGPGESRDLMVSALVTAAPGEVVTNVAGVSGGGAMGADAPGTPPASSGSADLTPPETPGENPDTNNPEEETPGEKPDTDSPGEETPGEKPDTNNPEEETPGENPDTDSPGEEPDPVTPTAPAPEKVISDPAEVTATTSGDLAETGASASPLIWAALLLLLCGGALLWLRRRRTPGAAA